MIIPPSILLSQIIFLTLHSIKPTAKKYGISTGNSIKQPLQSFGSVC